MSAPAEEFGIDPLVDLVRSYEGETSAAVYFSMLAFVHDGEARAALQAFADVERVTSTALVPVVERMGLEVADVGVLRRRGVDRAASERHLSWSELVADMCERWPSYVQAFERMLAAMPSEHRDVAQLMVDHEVALVQSAMLLRSGGPDALAPVREFVARH